MPWTIRDVDRFKSGLTQSQKERWVRIANDALRRCQQRGGSNCDASAIRQANGTVGNNSNNMEHLTIQVNSGYQIREETHNGKKHLVVPVTMMVEGVHNGSHGPLYHPISELGRFPQAWNGIPVVINHPQVDGTSVSANDPNVIDAEKVGTIYNTHVEDTKLKAEAWIDEQRLLAVSPSTCERLKQGEVIEVSVGVFNEEEQREGNWNDEHYAAIARNHRPDHLALLPDDQGACSVEDGCGIRSNKKGGQNEMSKKDEMKSEKLEFLTSLLANQDMDYKELVYDLQRKLDGWDNNDKVHYLQAVYDDYIIYQVRRVNDGSEEFYKQTYEVNEDEGTIEFVERPERVQKRVEFISTQKKSVFSNLKQFLTMSKKKEDKPCCPEKVDQLIVNKATRWEEDDREALNQLDEATIDKMFPVEVKEPGKKEDPPTSNEEEKETGTVQTDKDEKPKISKEDLVEALKEYGKDVDSFLKFAPQEVADHIREGVRLNNEKRTQLIKGITEHSSFKEDEVKDWSTERLQKLHDSVTPADYSGMGGGGPVSTNQGGNGEEVEPLRSPIEEKRYREYQTKKGE